MDSFDTGFFNDPKQKHNIFQRFSDISQPGSQNQQSVVLTQQN